MKSTFQPAGIDTASLDQTIPPSEDFFRFANGGWVAKNPIPPEYPRWGRFQELAEANLERLRDILEELIKSGPHAPGSNPQKLADFYRTGMDEAAVEAAGAKPLDDYLARIATFRAEDLWVLVAEFQRDGVTTFFHASSTQDFQDSTQVILEISQDGLGLPDRDYYLKTDDRSKELLAAYRDHIAKMFVLWGTPAELSLGHADAIVRLETRLAEASKTKVELRDPPANYHRMDLAGLTALAPGFDWASWISAIGVPAGAPITVGQPEFIQTADRLLSDTPLEELRVYLRWHLLDGTAPFLSQAFVEEDFRFNGTILTGAEKLRDRWKRVISQVDSALGEALGQVYVQRWFKPDAKARVRALVGNLKEALREDIEGLPWMGEETRRQAISKMDAFTDKIGYPDRWREYSGLAIGSEAYVTHVMRGHRFEFEYDIHKIGRPVDRAEWYMTPSTVNAYYNPLMNEIVFPAAILQPPFFNPEADDAANYGAIGAVIGHEMTHGFDDQGCQFDGQGNLRNWWTDEDMERFQTRAKAIVAQFTAYEVEPGLFINGDLVQGEAIADLGGLTLAWAAFQRARRDQPALAVLNGFTPEQRFFLGFAQIWASSMREEYAHFQVQNDPHPNPRFRVIGTLANMPAFQAAFKCPPDSPMVLPAEQRTHIW
ncbi:MAG TPA: M13 family metallopeptidase [Candidatus Xenobia bacterium]|jgi:putative endopeptidase